MRKLIFFLIFIAPLSSQAVKQVCVKDAEYLFELAKKHWTDKAPIASVGRRT